MPAEILLKGKACMYGFGLCIIRLEFLDYGPDASDRLDYKWSITVYNYRREVMDSQRLKQTLSTVKRKVFASPSMSWPLRSKSSLISKWCRRTLRSTLSTFYFFSSCIKEAWRFSSVACSIIKKSLPPRGRAASVILWEWLTDGRFPSHISDHEIGKMSRTNP